MGTDKYMISFSGGRTSAFMTNELLKDAAIANNAIICFANTGKENEETLQFVHDCERLWGATKKYIRRGRNPLRVTFSKVIWLEYHPVLKFKRVFYETASRKGEPFAALNRKYHKFLPNVMRRYCTQELKVRVIKNYLLSIGYQHWTNVVGIRHDEPKRYVTTRHVETRERWKNWYPLVEWKIAKADVLNFWKQMPFDLQLKDYQGNCDLCFLKGMYKKMQIIRDTPEKALWWIEQENTNMGTFHKGYSYTQLIQKINSQPELFAVQDEDIQCFCNTD